MSHTGKSKSDDHLRVVMRLCRSRRSNESTGVSLWRPELGHHEAHIVLQQDKHAPLRQLFGRVELVPGLSDVLCWERPSTSPLVVKVQPATVQFLQLVLRNPT